MQHSDNANETYNIKGVSMSVSVSVSVGSREVGGARMPSNKGRKTQESTR